MRPLFQPSLIFLISYDVDLLDLILGNCLLAYSGHGHPSFYYSKIIVFRTNGGMRANCNCFLKRLAEKISEKNGEPYRITCCHFETLPGDFFLYSHFRGQVKNNGFQSSTRGRALAQCDTFTVTYTCRNYEARFSTRKINDKIQNEKTSSKYKNDLP